MSGDFERGGRLVFFESPSLWSSWFFLLWFPMGNGSSSFRSTSLLAGLGFGVSSSSDEELVTPTLPLIAFFDCVGVLGLPVLNPALGAILLLPLV